MPKEQSLGCLYSFAYTPHFAAGQSPATLLAVNSLSSSLSIRTQGLGLQVHTGLSNSPFKYGSSLLQ